MFDVHGINLSLGFEDVSSTKVLTEPFEVDRGRHDHNLG